VKSEEIEWLGETLRLVPEGGLQQNLFRSVVYHNLAAGLTLRSAGKENGAVAEIVARAVDVAREDFPGFAPEFDRRLLTLEWPATAERVRSEEARLLTAVSATFMKLR
jgi:hypothetical protein